MFKLVILTGEEFAKIKLLTDNISAHLDNLERRHPNDGYAHLIRIENNRMKDVLEFSMVLTATIDRLARLSDRMDKEANTSRERQLKNDFFSGCKKLITFLNKKEGGQHRG